MTAMLHTNIEDPVERLQAIKKSLDEGKQYIDTPMAGVVSLPGALPPILAKPLARMYVRRKLTRRLPLGQATVITNVPGPSMDLYCAGARLVSFYPIGLINPGLGLFHAVFSFNGKIAVSITADRDQMPDPQFYRECLDASYEELHSMLLGKSAKVVSKQRGPRDTDKTDKTRAALPGKQRAAAKPKSKPKRSVRPKAGAKAKPAATKLAVVKSAPAKRAAAKKAVAKRRPAPTAKVTPEPEAPASATA